MTEHNPQKPTAPTAEAPEPVEDGTTAPTTGRRAAKYRRELRDAETEQPNPTTERRHRP
jgi:hypothetical protein